MGDVGRFIFGGSKETSKSTSTPTDMTPDAFKALQGPFAEVLKQYMQSGGPEYTGPLNADETAREQQIRDGLMGQTGEGTQRAGVINDTLAGKYLPGQSGANPFLEEAIKTAQRPTLQGLTETLDRTLPGRFTAAGQMVQPQGSSAFDRAAAIATRGTADALGDIATKMSYQGYEDERNRQQQAVQLSREEVDATVTNLQAQALPRLIEELGIERGLQVFQTKVASILDILKTIGGVTSPTIAQTVQSQSEGTSSKGAFSQLFPKGL